MDDSCTRSDEVCVCGTDAIVHIIRDNVTDTCDTCCVSGSV